MEGLGRSFPPILKFIKFNKFNKFNKFIKFKYMLDPIVFLAPDVPKTRCILIRVKDKGRPFVLNSN